MQQLGRILKNKTVRLALIVLIIGATFALFAQYLIANPQVFTRAFSLSPAAIMLLAIAYIGTIFANAFVLSASLRMIGKSVSFSENASLTGYSSVVNFFGPLQSGPGFRAAYLKRRHGVSVSKFFYATVVFYGFFAAINGLVILLALAMRAPNGLGGLILVSAAVLFALIAWLAYRFIPRVSSLLSAIKLTDYNFWLIGVGALLLALCTSAAYFIELIHVDPTVSVVQTIIYAAAANLALFVSLTPGAIGFRESFLLLTQQLHEIPSSVVIAASIIDRAFYVVFLLGLFLFLLAFGVRTKLKAKTSQLPF